MLSLSSISLILLIASYIPYVATGEAEKGVERAIDPQDYFICQC